MPLKKKRRTCSSQWTAEDAAEKLGVVYKGIESDEAYKEVLHNSQSGANIPRYDRPTDDEESDAIALYRSLIELLDFDDTSSEILALLTRVLPRGSRGPHPHDKCSSSPSSSDEDDDAPVNTCSVDTESGRIQHPTAFLNSLAESEQRIKDKKNYMLKPMHKLYALKSAGCHSMLHFVSWVIKLVQLATNDQQIDEDSFRQLFINFALIFNVQIRLVNSRYPLVLQGREVETNPDLLYEKFPKICTTAPMQVFTVTVSECKRVAKPKKKKSGMCSTANYEFRAKRPFDLIAQDSIGGDTTIFPRDLRGQHACQLVNELQNTFMPNKNCMLGFVVQGTKVRLTCLIMDREVHKRIREPDFEASTEPSEATIYFTKAYDMLQKVGRNHLAYIMVTLSSFAGDLYRFL